MPSVAQNKKKGHDFDVMKNLDVFNSIYRELDMFYVDSLEAQKVIRVGIDAMLGELDPYTVYYPEEEMEELEMMMTELILKGMLRQDGKSIIERTITELVHLKVKMR